MLMGLMALLGGFTISGTALEGTGMLANGLWFGFGFLLVGFFEEFAFRGFLQATLQRSLGRWPAAILLSAGFGAIHLPNLGGAWVGALVAMAFGLLGVFSLQRTGSLWFIIGAHAALDWSLAFFYSVPIAGFPAQGHLVVVTLSGPDWLTGGHAGPVGSLLAFAVFALAGILIQVCYPKRASAADGEGGPGRDNQGRGRE